MTLDDVIDLDRAPIVLVQRRWQILLLVLTCVPFVAAAYFARDDFGLMADIAAAFFGACGVVSLIMMVRPNPLTIGPDGLRFDQWFRSRNWRWVDLSDFTGSRNYLSFMGGGRPVTPTVLTGGVGMEPVGWKDGLRLVSGLPLAPVLEEARARWA